MKYADVEASVTIFEVKENDFFYWMIAIKQFE